MSHLIARPYTPANPTLRKLVMAQIDWTTSTIPRCGCHRTWCEHIIFAIRNHEDKIHLDRVATFKVPINGSPTGGRQKLPVLAVLLTREENSSDVAIASRAMDRFIGYETNGKFGRRDIAAAAAPLLLQWYLDHPCLCPAFTDTPPHTWSRETMHAVACEATYRLMSDNPLACEVCDTNDLIPDVATPSFPSQRSYSK